MGGGDVLGGQGWAVVESLASGKERELGERPQRLADKRTELALLDWRCRVG